MKAIAATIDTSVTRAGPEDFGAKEEARDRALAARIVGGSVRDLRPARTRGQSQDDEVEAFKLGWTASVLLNLVLLGTPLGLVLAVPPVLECREREARFGFFAGETFASCSTRGIGRRVTRLDDRIKMLVRGSGR